MSDLPQAFADALCNERMEALYRAVLADEADSDLRSRERWHQASRLRGVEGRNGVACAECRERAARIWSEYRRILESLT